MFLVLDHQAVELGRKDRIVRWVLFSVVVHHAVFLVAVNVWGAIWPRYTPQQLMSGNTPRRTLDEVWQSLLAKYAEYSVAAQDDLIPESK